MTVKDLKPTNDSGTPNSQEAVAQSQALSLEELRHQAVMANAMVKLKETNSAFDTLLEETISAVDEITSEVDKKVSDLIEAARSSAGRVARPDRDQPPLLTGEIWSVLEASIEQSVQSVLKDLQNLQQETKLSRGKSTEADPDPARSRHSVNNSESQDSNEFEAEMDDSASSNPTAQGATKADVEDSQGDENKEPGNSMATRLYRGHISLRIPLKTASDEGTDHITPDQISHQIKNTPGALVLNSGMRSKEYFIEANFETSVSLDEVLNGVSDWEDFEDQGARVKEYQKRASSIFPSRSSKVSKGVKRILVTL